MFPISSNHSKRFSKDNAVWRIDFRETFSTLRVYVFRRDIVIDTIYIVSFDSSGANVRNGLPITAPKNVFYDKIQS